jgi:hypothetical protein
MLILKLTIVPFFLMVISLVGKRFGPATAGWVAGLPVIVGPILWLLALEQGTTFAANAAHFTLASVFTVIAFGVAYARAATRYGWGVSLIAGLSAWFLAALLVSRLPLSLGVAGALALVTLLIAPMCYPPVTTTATRLPLPAIELVIRMLMGATLMVAVTVSAAIVGPTWSGIAALAPVLTPVLAVFIHRSAKPNEVGGAHAISLLSNLARGLYSLAVFCFVVAWQLEALGVLRGFSLALVAAILVQTATFYWRRK